MKKVMKVLLAVTLMVSLLNGCNDKQVKSADDVHLELDLNVANNHEDEDAFNTEKIQLRGSVTGSGSTSVKLMAEATMDAFMALNPSVEATYDSIGSSNGVKNAESGKTQIGAASRKLKIEEKVLGMTEVVIAFDGIAVIVHPSNEMITDLSMDQIKGIFTGAFTNWSEVGGVAGPIMVISREEGSGTRDTFEEIMEYEDALTADAAIVEGNSNVEFTVANEPLSIGYVSFTYLNGTVKAIQVEGIDATVENVLNGSFKVARPFIMMYHEENMSPVSQAYIDFVLSDAGQVIIKEQGGIPVN